MSDEKEGIMVLPIAEKTVAVALKHVFDQIKKIQEQELKETQQVHMSFIERFKEVQEKTSAIIKGAPIAAEDLKERQKFFSVEENTQVDKIGGNNTVIKDYWLIVMENYFLDDMSASDKDIAKSIIDISTNIVHDRLELTVEIGTNQWLKADKISRKFVITEGQLTKVEGNSAKWLKKKPQGILSKLLDGGSTQEQLNAVFPLVGDVINDMVPYSLQFFMGVVEDEDAIDVDDQDEDDEEGDGSSEEQVPKKKVKE